MLVAAPHTGKYIVKAPFFLQTNPTILTSYKNTVSARKQRLIQSNLFHHHGIRAELSQRTFDFSTHDHHNQASRILTEVLSIWVQVKWIPVFVISFMKNKLVYLFFLYHCIDPDHDHDNDDHHYDPDLHHDDDDRSGSSFDILESTAWIREVVVHSQKKRKGFRRHDFHHHHCKSIFFKSFAEWTTVLDL